MRRKPDHLLFRPDQQRPALAERHRVAGLFRGIVAGGYWLALAARRTEWIHDVNRPQSRSATTPDGGSLFFIDAHMARLKAVTHFNRT